MSTSRSFATPGRASANWRGWDLLMANQRSHTKDVYSNADTALAIRGCVPANPGPSVFPTSSEVHYVGLISRETYDMILESIFSDKKASLQDKLDAERAIHDHMTQDVQLMVRVRRGELLSWLLHQAVEAIACVWSSSQQTASQRAVKPC